MIPLKEAGMKLTYFRSFGTLVRVCRICKEDSFSHQGFVLSHDVKPLRHQEVKVGVTYC